MKEHFQILIVGGGTGGITTAARLLNANPNFKVGIVEPSSKHYYQPLWTLVGAGVFPKEETEREEKDYIPAGATWVQDAVESFDPENNTLSTTGGKTIGYDYLIVAAGIQTNWDGIPGLKENLGKHGVCSNYDYEVSEYTWENISNLKKGVAIFTHPDAPLKCPGAPQKICYLAEDYFRKNGLRDDVEVIFATAKPKIFGVPKYRTALEKVIERKGIITKYQHNLIEIKAETKEAVFENPETKEKTTIKYDMLHVAPPMGPMDFINSSPLTVNATEQAGDSNTAFTLGDCTSDPVPSPKQAESSNTAFTLGDCTDDATEAPPKQATGAGWVDVDKHTLQHVRFPNVFSLGDCSSLPTSKTGAGIRKQAPILIENLLAVMDSKPLTGHYDGYTSCPLVTGYGTLILAEFDYDGQPAESFPFDQAQERYSMYALKVYGLPRMYWHGMLRGRA